MCLDDNDFPLPAMWRQASGGRSEKETHEGEDDGQRRTAIELSQLDVLFKPMVNIG